MKRTLRISAVLVLFASSSWAGDANLRQTARTLTAKYAKVLATVKMTVEVQYALKDMVYSESKRKIQVGGTVLRDDGLTVISGANLEYASGAASEGDGEEGVKSKIEASEIQIRLAGGRFVEAEIIGHDKKLDLVFVRPSQKTKASCLRLEKAPSLKWRDDVLILYSLASHLKYRPAVAVRPVAAEGDGKSLPPVLDAYEGRALGFPAFDTSGRPIGIVSVAGSGKKRVAAADDDWDPDIVVWSAGQIQHALERLEKEAKKDE